MAGRGEILMRQMVNLEENDETVWGRREDKILAAKIAFGAGGDSRRTYPARAGFEQISDEQQPERKHRYGLWRFAVSVMLFFAFLAGIHYHVSFAGWNKERLEKMLADDTRWKQVVREVSDVMEHIPGRK